MQPLIMCLVLTGIHGFFVMAEFSIVKTSKGYKGGGTPAGISRQLSQIHSNLEEYLLVSQIGKTGTLMGLGFLLAGTDLSFLMPGQFVLVFSGIALIQIILGHEVPKYWGVVHSDQCAEAMSSFMMFSYTLVWPMLWIIKNLNAAFAHR